MLMITALIQPFRLEHVRKELLSADLVGLTIGECVGHGKNGRFVPSRIGGPDIPDILPKVKIEIAVPPEMRQEAIDAIVRGARLGNIGDGKIFVSQLDSVTSIRTGLPDDGEYPLRRWPAEAAE
jgi:nitrogen regulatory protein P-II 2